MDLRTALAIKRINLHLQIKKYLTSICYVFIAIGAAVYIFYAVWQNNKKYKLISDYQKNPQNFQVEKIMVNPRLNYQYNDGQIYKIKAKKAVHKNEEEVTLFDVYATGDAGNITSGQLVVSDDGNHLVFTQNPVLILNKTNNE